MMGIFKKIILGLLIFIILFLLLFFVGKAPEVEEIKWGVNFSQKHSEKLGLDWQENYLALIQDLNVKYFKIPVHWDLIEPEKDEWFFDNLNWQIEIAERKQAKILLVIGMKTPRWPECHVPTWANGLSRQEQEQRILKMLEKVVLHFRDSEVIYAWQVENEPFFSFGECPWLHSRKFLEQEVSLVKNLDYKNRPVIISDTGEWSFWFRAAKIGDIVGTTMYRKVWFSQMNLYFTYPITPMFYWRRSQLVDWLYNKEVACVELQAEPWSPTLLYDSLIQEQEKTMNLEKFNQNISYAKRTGFSTFYLWGSEWWYWMKTKQNRPEIWQQAGKLWINK